MSPACKFCTLDIRLKIITTDGLCKNLQLAWRSKLMDNLDHMLAVKSHLWLYQVQDCLFGRDMQPSDFCLFRGLLLLRLKSERSLS